MKFMKYYVESDDGKRVKCWYYVSNINGKKYVTIYADGYDGDLSFLPNHENNTDTITDYFEKDRARIYEGDPLYAAVYARYEKNEADRKAKREARGKKRF